MFLMGCIMEKRLKSQAEIRQNFIRDGKGGG